MEAGKLRHRLTLEEPAQTVAAGEPSIPWPIRATVWGSWEGLSGTNRSGIVAETANRFTIRYRSSLTPRWRIGLAGTARKFQILSVVDPDGRRKELTIVAQELLA